MKHYPGRAAAAALALAVAAGLAACGGGGGDSAAHEPAHLDSAGRLALLEDGSASVRIYDLDARAVAATIVVANPPSAVAASPGHRYALAIQRDQDLVQFVDGGLWQEDHVDHLHDYKAPPARLAFQLTGTAPTHYEVDGGQAALFMDGRDATAAHAVVALLSDAGIGAGRADATLALAAPMHGTAEPRGDYLLATYRPPGAASTLPTQVELYRRDGAAYAFVRRFDEACPGLHGSFSNRDHTAFGCEDGVLVVTRSGDDFAARKLPNPVDLDAGVRIGTVAGHPALPALVGIASPGHLFAIDPVAGTLARIAWADGRTRRAHAFDAHGERFLVLDDLGTLHLIDPESWTVVASLPAIEAMPAAAPFPSIAVSRAGERAYVTDPSGRRVIVVDLEAAAIVDRLALDFAPTGAAWLGIEAHDHAH